MLRLARTRDSPYLVFMNQLKSIPRRTEKKPKPPLKCAVVASSTRLTPNMQRVVLAGDDLKSFTPDRNGANLKVCIPQPDQSPDAFRAALSDNAAPKTLRTYTVQDYDPARGALTVDFALHDPAGNAPAGDWARIAKTGDLLGYRGPSDKKLTDFHAEHFILHGDMTALPAIGAILADMPRTAKGHAFFEVTHADDAQNLKAPDGVALHWLVHPDPSTASTLAIDAIKALDLPDDLQIAVAGEHSVVASLKAYFFDEVGLDPARNYASPYWKIGLVEEEHQILKKAERD